ncbi:MAG: VCBS repeat-containing protein [Polyangiaceae bacterium]
MPRLSAQQLASLLAQSADDVSPNGATDGLAASTGQGSLRRLNARAAIDDLSAKAVPPELELERPLWYETVVLDSLTQPMPITGRIAVHSGRTFDVHVEAALGNPNDAGKFTTLVDRKALAAESLVKSGSLLAQADLRTWYANALSSQGDGSAGAVVTLRVRAVETPQQTTDDDISPLESNIQRQIVIETDPTLLSGFPYVVESATTPPKLVDVDDSNGKEIVFGTLDGRVLALSTGGGAPKDAFQSSVISRQMPQYRQLGAWTQSNSPETASPILAGTPSVSPALGTESIVGGIAATDFDHDGDEELVFVSDTGRVYVVDHTGARVEGWPRCLDSTNAVDCPSTKSGNPKISAAPVLADVDGDGTDEIVVAANDGALYAFESDAKPVKGWPVHIPMPNADAAGAVTESPSVADLDGDERDDLVFSVGEPRDSERK